MNYRLRAAWENVRHTPIVSFFLRYWLIVSLLSAFIGLIASNALFSVVGMLIYLPALSLGALSTALLLRNIFNSKTTDQDADTGRFNKEWDELDGRTRVILTVIQILVYLLCVSMITAALAAR
jgi:hypothetical protein